ncbi:MAG: hypothetical protein KGH60_00390 [Candidatus Micrarchaeota archaeon]|nr:hypothetical protein [Candidatus Micrarchaeota archaeon]
MELYVEDGVIRVPGKVLNVLDKAAIEFVGMIDFDYVIISGYVAILFGRSRTTEDIDIFIDVRDRKSFSKFYKKLDAAGYYTITSEGEDMAYEMLQEGLSLRIAEKGGFVPNFEIKLPKTEQGRVALRSKIKLRLGKADINIAKIETQIAFKLFLGSEKDYDDARHLYNVFEPHIAMQLYTQI